MSPRVKASPRRATFTWLAIVAGALAAALVIGPPGDDGPFLDPSSTGPGGTKALVDTLGELGADVSVQADLPTGPGTALLLVDTLTDQERDAMSRWIDGGGTLVLADPTSPLNPASEFSPSALGPLDPELQRGCAVAALTDADQIVAPGALLMDVPAGAVGCYARDDEAWLLVVPQRAGTLVVVGGGRAFTNAQLDEADNAVLAAALLAPREDSDVTVVWQIREGSGDEGLLDLVPRGVELGIVQLGVAFVVVTLWRGRRLGRPVVEAQPVAVEGSESVAAVGRLLQRARGRAQAAGILREELRRNLATRLGLPAGAPADQVADAASAHSSLAGEQVLDVLAGPEPRSEEALVALARSVESLRREVEHGS